MATARRGKTATGSEDPAHPKGPRVLKKYPNRRLYDTQTSSYITLADVKKMVLGGEDFEVRDAKSGDESTRSILLQIILEEEMGGMPMFSTPLLAQIIRFYGHAMQGLMGAYLEKNLQAVTGAAEPLRRPEQGRGLRSAAVVAVHERSGADDAGPDGQLSRAVQEPVPADAGAVPERREHLPERSRHAGLPAAAAEEVSGAFSTFSA